MEPKDYPDFLTWTEENRMSNAFGYIDSRDAASSVVYSLGLITPTPLSPGHHAFLIANDDTVSPNVATAELVKKHFPGVPYEAGWTAEGGKGVGKLEGLLSTAKARKELGWKSEHGWRTQAGEGKGVEQI